MAAKFAGLPISRKALDGGNIMKVWNGIVALTVVCCLTDVAIGQGYPVKPIMMVVPFAPGGTNDLVGRPLAQKLAESLGKAVVIDNRGGAGGTTGTARVAAAAPDGYTLLVGSAGPLGTAPGFYKNLPYDAVKDLAPISLVMKSPIILVVNPVVPAKSVRDLIRIAKAKPKQLNYGSPGVGSMVHLAGELFDQMAKVQLVHVPYKGSGPAVIDLIAGRLDVMFAPIPPTLPHLTAGKLRGIAVGSRMRFSVFPDLPTVSEAGVPGYEVTQWWGVLAPAGTPDLIVSKLNAEIVKILDTREMKDLYTSLGGEPATSSPGEFSNFIRDEVSKWTKAIAAAGIASQI